MRTAGLLLGLALLGLLPGCPEERSPELPPAATLGQRVISIEDLHRVVVGMAGPGELPRDDAFAALVRRSLDERVIEEVLLLEAEARGLIPTPAEVQAEIDQMLGTPPSSEARAEAVALYGSEEDWVASVRRRLAVRRAQRAVRDALAEGTSVTPEQVEAARPRFEDRLVQPRRVHARQIFSTDPAAVRDAHERLEAGGDFADLAEELGAEDGGDLGWMTAASAPNLLLQATEELEPGQWTSVLKSPLGYHVFQLVEATPRGLPTAEAADALVETWLRDEAASSRLRAFLAARTEELGLVVHEDALRALRCCRDGAPWIETETK